MIKNYIKIAFRNLKKQKIYTVINSFGLAIALMVSIFIFLFVRDELSYDSFIKDSTNIYRIVGTIEDDKWGRINLPMEEAKNEFQAIQYYTRIWNEEGVVMAGSSGFNETISLVDKDFLSLFSYPMKYGNTAALNNMNSVVLTNQTAKKYFGSGNPLGKQISIQFGKEWMQFFVSGVVQDLPANTSVKFNVLIPYSNIKYTVMRIFSEEYGISNYAPSTFIKLRNATKNVFETEFKRMITRSVPAMSGNNWSLYLQPVKDIHLSTGILLSMQPHSNSKYSFILTGLGVLILLMSSFNFINLTIARSSHRFKEIGIRKVIGASRKKLILQFISEAMLLTFISLLTAIVLTELLLPVFNTLTGKNLNFNFYDDWNTITGILIIVLFVGLLSGFYPSFYLSRFKPINILKGEQKLSGKKPATRIMIILQFIISGALLISAIIMLEQFNYIQNKSLGFDKENIIVIKNPIVNGNRNYRIFKNEISGYSGVESVTGSAQMPGAVSEFGFLINTLENKNSAFTIMLDTRMDYLKTLGVKFKSGRDFSAAYPSDTVNSIIINEKLANELNLKTPVGSRIKLGLGDETISTVIGVVKNFNIESLERKISSVVIRINKRTPVQEIIVRLKPGNLISSISYLKRIWSKIAPGMPFDYTFLDVYLNNVFKSEKRWNEIINYSAIFAIFISLMGLFGLASFMVEKRTKEIGIRKVFGASLKNIAGLVYKEFLILVAAALIISYPVAWYFMNKWLQNFAYRIEINILPFSIASLVILGTAIIVTGVHAFKAAVSNPVDSLRNE